MKNSIIRLLLRISLRIRLKFYSYFGPKKRSSRLRLAAQLMKYAYENDHDLTALSNLDGEPFYEYNSNS